MTTFHTHKKLTTLLSCILIAFKLQAQDNYEIQVYASPTMEKGKTMLELHSNYTFDGSRSASDGLLASNHVFHETIEITHGWNSWFETGFYIFNEIGNGNRSAYVGSHIRPRVTAPASWDWPVGVSLSTEFGFQKRAYSGSTSGIEIRPIVDKEWGSFYVSFNPTVEKSFSGLGVHDGFTFSPNVKTSYALTKVLALGFEYYGSTGTVLRPAPASDQEHVIYLATDLEFSPDWEFNAGFGHALNNNGDNSIFKLILGRRF